MSVTLDDIDLALVRDFRVRQEQAKPAFVGTDLGAHVPLVPPAPREGVWPRYVGSDLDPARFEGCAIYVSPIGVDVILPAGVEIDWQHSMRRHLPSEIKADRRYVVWGEQP